MRLNLDRIKERTEFIHRNLALLRRLASHPEGECLADERNNQRIQNRKPSSAST